MLHTYVSTALSLLRHSKHKMWQAFLERAKNFGTMADTEPCGACTHVNHMVTITWPIPVKESHIKDVATNLVHERVEHGSRRQVCTLKQAESLELLKVPSC